MEEAMMRKLARPIAIAVITLVVAACGGNGGGGGPKLLVDTPPPGGGTAVTTGSDPGCQSAVGAVAATTMSDLRVTGPCQDTELGAARCVKRPDDFYAYISHDLPGNGRFILTVNVENYHGSNHYPRGAEIYLEVSRGGQFYYWSVRHAEVTVAETPLPSADIPHAILPAQAGTPASGSEIVSGTVACPSFAA